MVTHDPRAHAVMPSGAKPEEIQRVQQEIVHRVTRGDMCTAMQVLNAYPEQVSSALAIDEKRYRTQGGHPLHLAARGGHLAMVRELLSKGAQANARDERQRSPLHVACEEGHEDVALELLMAGAEADAVDDLQETALHKAAMLGSASLAVFRVLLEVKGANASIGTGTQTTPLMILAGLGLSETVEYVVKRDPSLVAATNSAGWTPLHLAAHGREMRTRSLKESHEGGKFAACCRLLLEAKAEVDAHDEDRKAPLHRAAATGNLQTAKELLRFGADANDRDNCRWTPLHYAVQDGHMDVATLLLNAKAEVQTPSSPCIQPLALAVMENQVKIAELLVSHKADPDLRSKGVASAFMLARKDPEKYSEILGLFELGWISHAS